MTEREQFESAMLESVIMPRPHLVAHIETIFERYDFGDCGYKQMWLDSAWIGWQAARATPALPQGVEEWADTHGVRASLFDPDVLCVAVCDLMKLLSGMAIVPVEQVEKILPRIDAELQVIDAIIQCTQAMLPQETLDEIETSLALLQDIRAMLAAAKEKGE